MGVADFFNCCRINLEIYVMHLLLFMNTDTTELDIRTNKETDMPRSIPNATLVKNAYSLWSLSSLCIGKVLKKKIKFRCILILGGYGGE